MPTDDEGQSIDSDEEIHAIKQNSHFIKSIYSSPVISPLDEKKSI